MYIIIRREAGPSVKQSVPSNKIESDVGPNERVRQDPHAEGDLTG